MSAKIIQLETQKVSLAENGWLLHGAHGRYSLSRGLDSMQCIDKLTPRDLDALMMLLSHYITTRGRR